jgi:hypothetical protein
MRRQKLGQFPMSNEPERPRHEPEIIPPDRVRDDDLRRATGMFGNAGGTHRIYVTRIGPFGVFLIAFVAAALPILILVFLIGTFLIWIPIVGLLVAAAILSSFFRLMFQRPR